MARPLAAFAAASLMLLLCVSLVAADEHTHHYKEDEEVTVWVNKVGPYANPQETYTYYSLPFCKPQTKKLRTQSDSFGSLLEGNDLSDSGFQIRFKESKDHDYLCSVKFTDKTENEFKYAIRNQYWYQMYIDDLPLWGMVGEMVRLPKEQSDKASAYIYTHKTFTLSYNGDQIVQANLTSGNPVPLSQETDVVDFTFSVKWVESDIAFPRRFDVYLDSGFFEHQIHWFSIFNSLMMVLFLLGLVVVVLMRTLKRDYAKYVNESDELDLERVVEESGWKQVHGDVFRSPKHLMLFSALIGTGAQLGVLVFLVTALAYLGKLYVSRGSVVTSCVVSYALTSLLSGAVSASYYKRNGGQSWKKLLVMTATLFPGVVSGSIFCLNLIAVMYGSTVDIPVGTMFTVVMIWLVIALPLSVIGTIIGRNFSTANDYPCRVNSLLRPIPTIPWYLHPASISLLSGILPFASIFIEMYFVFTSLWNYKFYYVYSLLLLVYLILIAVTVCVTIVATYLLLNSEDYRWQWTSFFCGASTALYVFMYAIYYYNFRTKMNGFLQFSFYFGYMGLISLSIFLLCGTVGFFGSSVFVNRIYHNIKSD